MVSLPDAPSRNHPPHDGPARALVLLRELRTLVDQVLDDPTCYTSARDRDYQQRRQELASIAARLPSFPTDPSLRYAVKSGVPQTLLGVCGALGHPFAKQPAEVRAWVTRGLATIVAALGAAGADVGDGADDGVPPDRQLPARVGRGMYPTGAAFHEKRDEVIARLRAEGTRPTRELIADGMFLRKSRYHELLRRYPKGGG